MQPSNRRTSHVAQWRRVVAGAGLSLFFTILPGSGTAFAAVSGGFGLDRLSGPNARSYKSALVFGSLEGKLGDFTVAATRYEDTRVGGGVEAFANAGLAPSSSVRLRMIASRAEGDRGYAAWRLRAGPEARLGWGFTVAAYHLHLGDTSPASVNALGVEVSRPLASTLLGQVGGAFVRPKNTPATVQTTLALSWRPARQVQFLGEVNVGRNAVTTTSSGPGGSGPMDLPVLRGLGTAGSSTDRATEKRFEAVGLLGVRILIP